MPTVSYSDSESSCVSFTNGNRPRRNSDLRSSVEVITSGCGVRVFCEGHRVLEDEVAKIAGIIIQTSASFRRLIRHAKLLPQRFTSHSSSLTRSETTDMTSSPGVDEDNEVFDAAVRCVSHGGVRGYLHSTLQATTLFSLVHVLRYSRMHVGGFALWPTLKKDLKNCK